MEHHGDGSGGTGSEGGAGSDGLRIDCDECVMAGTSACDDCVVSFILNREPGDAIVVDAAEERALRALGAGGGGGRARGPPPPPGGGGGRAGPRRRPPRRSAPRPARA